MLRLVFVFIIYCLSFPLFALDVTDDANQHLHLAKPAQRIISLAPDITEILFAISANDLIVGVIAGANYPDQANALPKVGSYLGLDLEKIYKLQPDLIINWGNNFIRQLNFLKADGLKVYINQPENLADVATAMEKIGRLVNKEQAAKRAASAYRAQLMTLTRQYHNKPKLKVFYQIGDSLITINHTSWINQAIEVCGGRNIFANIPLASAEMDLEAIVMANPDVILASSVNQNWQKRWQAWPKLTAVNQHALFSIEPDLIERAGPRLLAGVAQICHALEQARLSKG